MSHASTSFKIPFAARLQPKIPTFSAIPKALRLVAGQIQSRLHLSGYVTDFNPGVRTPVMFIRVTNAADYY